MTIANIRDLVIIVLGVLWILVELGADVGVF